MAQCIFVFIKIYIVVFQILVTLMIEAVSTVLYKFRTNHGLVKYF